MNINIFIYKDTSIVQSSSSNDKTVKNRKSLLPIVQITKPFIAKRLFSFDCPLVLSALLSIVNLFSSFNATVNSNRLVSFRCRSHRSAQNRSSCWADSWRLRPPTKLWSPPWSCSLPTSTASAGWPCPSRGQTTARRTRRPNLRRRPHTDLKMKQV